MSRFLSSSSAPPGPFFRRYYAAVYALFPFVLVGSITGMDLCFLLLLFGGLAELYLRPEAVRVDRKLLGVVLAFLGLLLIPELIHFSWTGLEELVAGHFRKVFLLVLMVGTLRSEKLLDRTVSLWILAGATAALLTAAAVVTEWEVLSGFVEGGSFDPGSVARGNGPGNWKANQFGNVLAILFPFAFFRTIDVFGSRRPGRTLLWGGSTFLIVLGVFVSYSRTPLAAVLLVPVFYGIYRGIRWLGRDRTDADRGGGDFSPRAAALVFLCVVSLTGAMWLAAPSDGGRFTRVLTTPDPGDEMGIELRLELWSAVLEKAVTEPGNVLLGAGTGRGMKAFRYVADEPIQMIHGFEGSGQVRHHAHNNLIQYLLDYGVFGVIAYLGLWGYILLWILRGIEKPGLSRYKVVGFYVVLVFNLCGLTEYNWGRSLSHYNVMFAVGLILSAISSRRHDLV